MLARAMDAAAGAADPLPSVQRVFETIGFAKMSTSGADARRLGYLRDERRHHDEPGAADRRRQGAGARSACGGLSRRRPRGRDPRRRRERAGGAQARRPPRAGAPDASAITTRSSAASSPTILAGGALPTRRLSEQQLLDLEREAFLSLCGERKTLERIAAHAENRQAAEELVPIGHVRPRTPAGLFS